MDHGPWSGMGSLGRIISKMPLFKAVGLSEPRASSSSLNLISITFCFSLVPSLISLPDHTRGIIHRSKLAGLRRPWL